MNDAMTDTPLPFDDLAKAIYGAFGHFVLRPTPGGDDE